MKVLVVDDHPTVRQMAARLLECLGYDSLEARDADEAEATLQLHEVELILIDLCLDGMDGAAVARRLEAAQANLHVLFMSGVGSEVFAARALDGPRRGFIEKPFSLTRLNDAIADLLARTSKAAS